MTSTSGSTTERADLLQALGTQRQFLRYTTRGLSDEQAAARTTVSELCLGGIVKHVADVESSWSDFIVNGPAAMNRLMTAGMPSAEEWRARFSMLPGETLAGLLERYEAVARTTEEIVVEIADLDGSHPLPDAPWFEKGKRWSARRVLLHIVAETAQHAGHADIIREARDGAKTMG